MSQIRVNTIQNANGTTGITFAANGQVTLANTPLQLTGGQIVFPATQVPSADANTLDDYEEGTWTPNVGGNATYTVQVGRYVKVGSQVTAWGQMTINVLGTGSNADISGLPFTSANISDNLGAGGMSYFSSLAINQIAIYPRVEFNASQIRFATMSASASGVTNAPAILGNSTRMAFMVTYIAA